LNSGNASIPDLPVLPSSPKARGSGRSSQGENRIFEEF
jgi:hypothetical protein